MLNRLVHLRGYVCEQRVDARFWKSLNVHLSVAVAENLITP